MLKRKLQIVVIITLGFFLTTDRAVQGGIPLNNSNQVIKEKTEKSNTITGHKLNDKIENSQTYKWFWDFNKMNDSEGWTIPEPIKGAVMGGAIWLSIQQDVQNIRPLRWEHQVWGKGRKYEIESPTSLAVPAEQVNKVKMRILNLSPETDGLVFWRTEDDPNSDAGRVRFTMKPDHKEWQEVICHIDGKWKGTINQIRVRPALHCWRGDIWIDWIAITDGEPKPRAPRPDVCSDKVVPRINIPGISQKDFQDAFKVLDECLVTEIPVNGFNYPFMAPGGAYGDNWWQLDGSLNIAGAKWVNQKLCENMMRGFAEVQAQNPDGRIDLWGGSPVRGQVANVSSIPRYFETAYDIARRTGDLSLRELIYQSMKKYLQYWFSPVKRDQQTGLITAVFEETFSHPNDKLRDVAPVDLNVAVAIGCYNTSRLSEHLGKPSETRQFSEAFEQLCQSINRYLWNEEKCVYYNFNVHENRQSHRLICTTFDPIRLGIAPSERITKLYPTLLNPTLFNWGVRPVTSIARTEPDFVEATGPYDGSAWFGDIWTMRNLPIIAGLEDAGRHDLAAELTWSTVQTFKANFCEYVVPSNGSGEGVQRYGWTASQYIQAIIEHLFGIDYNRIQKRLRIFPHVPECLLEKEISISNLIIPSDKDTRLDLIIKQTITGEATFEISINEDLSKHILEVFIPEDDKKNVQVFGIEDERLTIAHTAENLTGVIGIRVPMKKSNKFQFKTL